MHFEISWPACLKEPCHIWFNHVKPLNINKKMKKYVCNICGYVYDPINGDPDSNIAPGTPFEKLPSDWVCPLCGVGKEDFSPVDE